MDIEHFNVTENDGHSSKIVDELQHEHLEGIQLCPRETMSG